MLDTFTPQLRHAVIVLIGAVASAIAQAVLTWAPAGVPEVLAELGLAPYAGAAVTVLALILTPLTRQYGAGAPDVE